MQDAARLVVGGVWIEGWGQEMSQRGYGHNWSRRDCLKLAASSLAIPTLSRIAAARTRRTALIIGSGIAGLSAAYELQTAGFAVTVMEKWDFVGGRMRDAKLGPLHLAPHALGVVRNAKQIEELAAEVGIAEDFAGTELGESSVVDNGIGKYDMSLQFDVNAVLKIPGFSPETLKKLPLLQGALDEIRRSVDVSDISTGASYDGESVREFMERILGRPAANQFMDYWFDFFAASWGWTRDDTAAIAAASWMAHGEPTITPRAGIGVLTRRLAQIVPVQVNTCVRYITPPDRNGRHTVHYLTPSLEAESITPDVVVCATEGKYVPELVQGLDSEQVTFFKSIDFTKMIAVAYVLSKDASPIQPIQMAFPLSHPDPMKRRIWSAELFPEGVGHPDNPPFAMVAPQRSEVPNWQRSGLSQQDYCLPLLKFAFPALDTSKIVDVVVLGCDDLAQMQTGFITRMAKILQKQESQKHGLYFAGEYLAGAHTAAACASGRRTGRTIVKHFA